MKSNQRDGLYLSLDVSKRTIVVSELAIDRGVVKDSRAAREPCL